MNSALQNSIGLRKIVKVPLVILFVGMLLFTPTRPAKGSIIFLIAVIIAVDLISCSFNPLFGCGGGGGGGGAAGGGAVAVDSLKMCLTSCDSGSSNFDGGTITLNAGEQRYLKSCYNDHIGCTNAAGDTTDDTFNTTWVANNTPDDAISTDTTAGHITANSVSGGNKSENYAVTYGLSTLNVTVNVVCNDPVSCSSEEQKYCAGESFVLTNSCGQSATCTGTRYCDFNWKEVAP